VFRRRALVRRPRILGAALIGGLGFAAGRAIKAPDPARPPAPEALQLSGKLKDLADLHDSGALTDAEFASAKRKLLGS
jgi:hypothetical protein